MGKLLYRHDQISVHNTNQFSLDVILHHQFARSRHRTNDPSEADVFYVPAYMGSMLFCSNYNNNLNKTSEMITRLFRHLNTFPYFAQEKPHVTSLAKIEREQNDIVLAHPGWKKLTYMTIEKANKKIRDAFHMQLQHVIVAPYPSYIHFNSTTATNTYAEVLCTHDRNIFLLLAASLQMSNPFRAKIIGQFVIKTKLSFKEYQSSNRDQVMLVTVECEGNHQYTTIE
ncbi:probable xyloglucan galactosyltransferase GT17 [Gigantopelta aegis]|uniref:probable xyloglucan galactosyltransferase GT17 n=1 Tax=Gigantopelta aegis TaxID=1735272 RepID=UPI001B8880A6|nr:probable xyloglucan galactosyltransferase GT17 [Gigantopelta aegis]